MNINLEQLFGQLALFSSLQQGYRHKTKMYGARIQKQLSTTRHEALINIFK